MKNIFGEFLLKRSTSVGRFFCKLHLKNEITESGIITSLFGGKHRLERIEAVDEVSVRRKL